MATLPPRKFQQILDEIGKTLRVMPGRDARVAMDDVFVMVAVLDPLDDPVTNVVTLGWGVPPKPAVQDLAGGILSSDGEQVIAVFRTNRSGQTLIKLHPEDSQGRECRIRFVLEVRDRQDVDILVRLGDEAARDVLQDQLLDEDCPDEMRNYIEEQLCVDSSKAAVTLPSHVIWRTQVPWYETIAGASEDEHGLPSGEVWGVSKDRSKVLIRCPDNHASGVRFPYGAALLELVAEDGSVLANRLMAVSHNERIHRFESSLELTALLPKGIERCDSGQLLLWEVRDLRPGETPADFPVWERLSRKDFAFLCADPTLQYDPELQARLSRLAGKLSPHHGGKS